MVGFIEPEIQGQTLPPPRRAVQALVAFLTAILAVLSVFCASHSFSLGASPVQQSAVTVANPELEAAFAHAAKLRNQQNSSAAIPAYVRAVALAERLHDASSQARGLIILGILQVANFQYRAALQSQNEASRLAAELHDPRLGGTASGNLATIYSQVGDWPSAESEAARAIILFRQISNPTPRVRKALAQALQSHAYICFYLQRNAEGYTESAEALSLAQSMNDESLQALIWDVRGSAFTRERRISDAASSLKNALALSGKLQDKDGIAFAKEHLAELELERSNPDWHLALQLINEADDVQSSLYKSFPQYIPIHIRGKILLGSGNKLAALSEFKRAVLIADEWRLAALPGDGSKTLTVAALQDVYADYSHLAAEVALETKDKTLSASALEVLAANRAASLREQLRTAFGANGKLTDDYFAKLSLLQSAQAKVTLGVQNSEQKEKLDQIRVEITKLDNQIGIKPEKLLTLGERKLRRNSLRDIQRTLGGDQVLISISLGKKQSFIWAVTGDQVHLSKLPAESDIQSKADIFKSSVRNSKNLPAASHDLSRALFEGLPADVWNRSEWLIVADGPLLNGVPFCALSRPNGNSLIKDRSLRFLPSEMLLLDRKAIPLPRKFLGVGDPIYNLADARLPHLMDVDAKTASDTRQLARLAGSETEIEAAAQESGVPSYVLLSGRKATLESLNASLSERTGIVHFAVHVVSPRDQPQQAALALSLKHGLPELLTSELVAAFHVPGSLVVLSGCSSGQGRILPGSGLVGLSRAWLLAGASVVIVSSWPTPDDTGRFFSTFYRYFDQLKYGYTAQRAALALQRTQLDMLHGSGYQTSPSFWGAFAVISKE